MGHVDNLAKIDMFYQMYYKEGGQITKIAQTLEIHRRTASRWRKEIDKMGIHKFKEKYKNAKKGRRRRNKTPEYIKVKICNIREEFLHCCGQKVRYILSQREGITLSVSTIYRVLNERYDLQKKYKKWNKRLPVRKGERAGEVVQVDTIDLGGIYAFTAIDTYSRALFVRIQPRLEATDGAEVLEELLAAWGPIDHIQRDGGAEFQKEWDALAKKHVKEIRTARPYKKNEQAYIERVNRILRDECLGYWKYSKEELEEVQAKVDAYLHYYHYKRPHMGLDYVTPAQLFPMGHLT